jgi:hypothetical protein
MCQGFGELNPIMAYIVEHGSAEAMAVFKILFSLLLLAILQSYREFHKWIDVLIAGYVILYASGWAVQFFLEVIWTR